MSEECLDIVRYDGLQAFPSDVEACYEFGEPKDWAGIWRYGFEESTFCVGATDSCASGEYNEGIWLSFSEGISFDTPASEDMCSNFMRVRFVGRMSEASGAFGHGGAWSRQIIVDDVISSSAISTGCGANP